MLFAAIKAIEKFLIEKFFLIVKRTQLSLFLSGE